MMAWQHWEQLKSQISVKIQGRNGWGSALSWEHISEKSHFIKKAGEISDWMNIELRKKQHFVFEVRLVKWVEGVDHVGHLFDLNHKKVLCWASLYMNLKSRPVRTTGEIQTITIFRQGMLRDWINCGNWGWKGKMKKMVTIMLNLARVIVQQHGTCLQAGALYSISYTPSKTKRWIWMNW